MKMLTTNKESGNSFSSSYFIGKESSSHFFGSDKHFFNNKTIQTKLNVNQTGDKYEQEADSVADKVVQLLSIGNASIETKNDNSIQAKPLTSAIPITPLVQMKCSACDEEEKLQKKEVQHLNGSLLRKPIFEVNSEEHEKEKNIQRKCTECEKEDEQMLQTKSENNSTQSTSASLENSLSSSKGSGNPLPEIFRKQMQSSFETDFSDVRIHNNSQAVQMSSDLNAQAFTHGSDIYFNSGKYNPDSISGKHLLAHELTHVVQQGETTSSQASIEQTLLQRSPQPEKRKDGNKKGKPRSIDLKTARLVMGWIIQIVNKLHTIHPSNWSGNGLLAKYRDLLTMWYELTNGKKTNGSTSKLKGEMFLSQYELAKSETEPILNVTIKQGGGTWHQLLLERWYPKFYEFESLADSEKRIIKITETTPRTLFWLYPSPEPVSIDEFLSDVAKQNSQVVTLQRGEGIKVGVAKAGITYYASKYEPRLLLWASPTGVFFLLDNQIYAQSLAGFSNDIILGTIIKAAQDVGPFVQFITFVVDLAISLSPVGLVYDITMAAKAASEGNWRDAALELLPGPAIAGIAKLGKATKFGRTVFRGGAKGAQFLGKAISGTATFVGKGFGKIGGKVKRGLWLVTKGADEAGGKEAFHFLDEAKGVWLKVPKNEAMPFIKCSKCDLTKAGKGESKFTTEEIQQHILEETGTKVSAGERALDEIGVSKKVLQAVRAKHHLFVQQLRKWFKSKKLDIDKYTIKLSADEHRLIHNEYRWNDIWKDFMKANPNASKRKLFKQMRAMLKEYGLEGLPIIPYK